MKPRPCNGSMPLHTHGMIRRIVPAPLPVQSRCGSIELDPSLQANCGGLKILWRDTGVGDRPNRAAADGLLDGSEHVVGAKDVDQAGPGGSFLRAFGLQPR